MEESQLYSQNENGITLRDITAVALRHRRLISLTFLSIFSGAVLIAILQANRYEAALKILVKKDRVDAMVSADATATAPQNSVVTEEELNSEVVLLKSQDLLEKIVLACNLQRQKQHSGWAQPANILPRIFKSRQDLPKVSGLARPAMEPSLLSVTPNPDIHTDRDGLDAESINAPTPAYSYRPVAALTTSGSTQSDWPGIFATIGVHPSTRTREEDIGIAGAVRVLEKDLRVEVLKKTNLISASYESSDPQLAARVLTALGNAYLEKHVEVHRPAGAFNFFQREAQKYREELTRAERRLLDFNQEADVVSAPLQKEITLQKLAEFKVNLSQTEAAIAETQQRIRKLQETASSIPTRMVTQVRNADDAMLVTQLKTNLLTLEQKRVELLGKFQPNYRPVKEVDEQIARARAALAERSPVHEEVTDRDPTYEWTRGELAKASADLAGLQARAQATSQAVQAYEANARSLASKEVIQEDLVRAIKAAEENYMLSERKEEEARISDALDRGRILNVAIADPATVPSLPSNHRLRTVLFGALLALFISATLAFAAERADPTFRTPDEVGSILNIPVLAAVPENGKGSAASYA